MKETITTLCQNIQLMLRTEPKFKTTSISVTCFMPASPELASARAMVQSLLLNSCEKYPTVAAMSSKMQSMYGAFLDGAVSMAGDVWQMHLTVSTIADCFAPQKEPLCQEAVEFLLQCLLHPNARNQAFDEKAFQMEQQDLLDTIESEVNHKRAYANQKIHAAAFQNESAAYPVYGTREDVLQLTPESVYQVYQDILNHSQILICAVVPEETSVIAERFTQAFQGRAAQELCFESPSPCKAEVLVQRESMQLNQDILTMAYKPKEPVQTEAFRLCSLMFGGAPFSMLFSDVREKQSLCYYCSSANVYGKQTMLVSSGVSHENLEKAQNAIAEQLELLKKGEFEDTLLEDSRRYMINALRLTGDTPNSCIGEMTDKYVRKDHADTEQKIALFEQATREDIIRIAGLLVLDSVYILEQEGQADET